jgi:hypothetical protein
MEDERMKALTLWQPYASLIATSAKRIETRSWYTAYRGTLLIHASKNVQPEMKLIWGSLNNWDFCDVATSVLEDHWIADITGEKNYLLEELPAGVIVGSVELVGCEPITDIPCLYCQDGKEWEVLPGQPEYLFGDYTEGRWAWLLANPKRFNRPIPAKGMQGLWTPDLATLEAIKQEGAE